MTYGMEPEPLLVHACCGPCATVVAERFPGRRPILFFYNPNVHPRAEYDRRLEAARRVAEAAGLELVAGPYDPETWRAATAGLEAEPEGGARCRACFALRLARTAEEARRRGIGFFSTTLTTSPHKRADDVFAAGRSAEGAGAAFVAVDLKKSGGFNESVRRSQSLGIYRQSRCGCLPLESPDR